MSPDEADEVYRALANALRRVETELARRERDAAALRARVDQLLELLVARGDLAPGHRRLVDKVGERAADEVPRRVRLRQYVDKYDVANADVDCAARLPFCRARCCMLSFELTTQDLDEGAVRWEVEEPYVIRHDADGNCTHLDRATGACGVYERRPATCRTYSCREDRRIWLDFDARIPAPFPERRHRGDR